ncbi:TPA: hypothetical protein ACJG8U_000018 [Salmonella enterica subsp. enterica serovar Warragul]
MGLSTLYRKFPASKLV